MEERLTTLVHKSEKQCNVLNYGPIAIQAALAKVIGL